MSGEILLNETYAIDPSIAQDWRAWMTEKYIPEVMASGSVNNYIFSAVNNGINEGAVSFALQFVLNDRASLYAFEKETDRKLKAEMSHKFAGKYASFPTVLNIINKD